MDGEESMDELAAGLRRTLGGFCTSEGYSRRSVAQNSEIGGDVKRRRLQMVAEMCRVVNWSHETRQPRSKKATKVPVFIANNHVTNQRSRNTLFDAVQSSCGSGVELKTCTDGVQITLVHRSYAFNRSIKNGN